MYEQLDAGEKEIRLLELSTSPPSNRRAWATGTLHTVPLAVASNLNYAALSYVWGNPKRIGMVTINGFDRVVTMNLAQALRCTTERLRKLFGGMPSPPSYFVWVDAICINQNDLDERGQQVSMMGDIFSSAHHVIAFLGADAFIPTAVKTLTTIAAGAEAVKDSTAPDKHLEWLPHAPQLYAEDFEASSFAGPEVTFIPNECWVSLSYFAQLDYWGRMWICQELVLAQRVMFTCGDSECIVIADALWTALHSLGEFLSILDLPCPEFCSQNIWTFFQKLRGLRETLEHAFQPIYMKEKIRGLEGSLRIIGTTVMVYTKVVRATDPRDYYYGLINMADIDLKPSYQESNQVEDACINFVNACLEKTRGTPNSLLFLRHAAGSKLVISTTRMMDGTPLQDIKKSLDGTIWTADLSLTANELCRSLPSWAPRYHLDMRRTLEQFISEECCADEGVFGGNLLSAALPEVRNKVLRVLGVRIDSAISVSYTLNGSSVPGLGRFLRDYVRRHGEFYHPRPGKQISAAMALFSVLFGAHDRPYDSEQALMNMEIWAAEGENPEEWSSILETHRRTGSPSSPDPPDQTLNDNRWPDLGVLMAAYGDRTDGHLFATKEGYMVIAPEEVLAGDEVWVLDGSSLPVVLRPTSGQFELVGVCQSPGLMKGEAKALVDGGKATPAVLELI